MNLFLLLLGMESLCALVTESFHLITPVQTYLWLALLCFLLWIASHFRYGILVGLPLSALTLYLLYREYSKDLLAEFQDLMGHISSAYYGNYSTSGTLYSFEASGDSHMTALLFLMFLLAAFTAISLSAGSFRIMLAELASIPVAAACIAINGAPSIYPILGLLLYWIGLIVSGDVFHPDDAAWKQLGVGMVFTLALMAVLLLFFGPKHYEYTEQDIHLSQQFDRLGELLSNWLSDNDQSPFSLPQREERPSPEDVPQEREDAEVPDEEEAMRGWSTPEGKLDLTIPFDSAGLDRTLFRLNANLSGALYLRGRSYGDYAGTSWLAAAENTHASALSYTAQAVFRGTDHSEYHFQLSGSSVFDVLYLPYYSVSDVLSDISVSSDGRSSYGGDFYMPTASSGYGSLPDSLRDEELQYREFAHNYYTRLPDSTKTALLSVCAEHNLDTERSDLLAAVAEYVRSVGEYDINTDPYPDSDYAVYFLTTAQRGYCIHYATAAAALYRSLGIPARLCEGYLVYALNGRSVSVTGMDAHAWVEVYMDGVGWIPVEVTASQSDGDRASQTESTAAPESTAPAEIPLSPEEAPAETGAAPGDKASPEASGEADNEAAVQSGDAAPVQQLILTPDPEPGTAQKIRSAVLRVLLAVFIPTVLVFGRYALMRIILRKRLHAVSGRERVINQYLQAERVLRFGGEMPEEIRIPAEKASFSPHELSEEEASVSAAALQTLTDSVWNRLSLRRKFVFRFLMGNK
ncbi:MAG: hypothetical protein K6C08_12295 [Oscillospiraceae bacterium]|nr:hypothetical protein [Oscillospiraceae bacterium]